MRFINRKHLALVGAAAALVAASSTGTAVAGHLIGSADIENGSIRSVDIKDGDVRAKDLSDATIAKLHGKDGKDGKDGLVGAVYRVENYKNGGGGSATVACADDAATSQKYTAIAGGVQGSTVADQSASGFAVSSSFPGRMDWDTNTPKPNRLDGWIVLGNGQYTGTLKVWALCVPTSSIPVQQVELDN
jgi:hypothetical protein